MNNYTVLLLRPEYLADEFGHDTYLAHVTANGVAAAMEAAQCDAWTADTTGEVPDESGDLYGSPNDYHVLFATMGHLKDMSRGGE